MEDEEGKREGHNVLVAPCTRAASIKLLTAWNENGEHNGEPPVLSLRFVTVKRRHHQGVGPDLIEEPIQRDCHVTEVGVPALKKKFKNEFKGKGRREEGKVTYHTAARPLGLTSALCTSS